MDLGYGSVLVSQCGKRTLKIEDIGIAADIEFVDIARYDTAAARYYKSALRQELCCYLTFHLTEFFFT